MAQRNTWFATSADAQLIVLWLREAGAVGHDNPLPTADRASDGREFILHFPSVGPIEFWPDEVRPSDYTEGSERWRQAVIIAQSQKEHPGGRQVDADHSPVAGLRLPEFRDGQHWVSGCVWFPGARLRETFPDLARICQRFDRFIRQFPTIYKNPSRGASLPFDYQLCMSGFVQHAVALPEAHALLERGAFMIDHNTSEESYRIFRRRLQLSGHVAS